ncbi:CvpA family protein, partial [Escherichia coli]|nr:CvpA family protein [Escherichia coli]
GIGSWLSRGVKLRPLKAVNRVFGALASFVIAALLISPVAFSLSNLGVPFVSQALSQSGVIRTIDSLTPTPIRQAIAQWRSAAVNQG